MCSPASPARRCCFEGDRVIGVRTGDRGIDREGQQQELVRAGRRHSCEGHDLLRRRARQPDEAAAAAAAAGGRAAARAVRDRHQGAVGDRPRPPGGGDRDSHARVSAADGGVRRRLHLRDAATDGSRWAWSSVSTITIRLFDPFTAFQRFKLHPLVSGPAAGRAAREVRREGACPKADGTPSRASGWTARCWRATARAS